MAEKKDRDAMIDVLRGIAIILVVLGHAGINGHAWHVIYSFHMPLFFFISGCFFKPLKEWTAINYLKALKWKGIYKPFVVYSLCFLALSPLLYRIGLSSTHLNSWNEVLKSLELILRFRTATVDLLGQFWFMPVLFAGHAFTLMITQIIRNKYVMGLTALVLYLIGYTLFLNGYKEPYDFSRVMYLSAFYMIGYIAYPFMKVWLSVDVIKYFVGFLFFALICFYNQTLNIAPLSFIVALAGIVNSFQVAIIITNFMGRGKKCLLFIGKHTMSIYVYHCLIIKVIEYLLSMCGLMEFTKGWHGCASVTSFWWLYTLMGVAVPTVLILGKQKVSFFLKHNHRL